MSIINNTFFKFNNPHVHNQCVCNGLCKQWFYKTNVRVQRLTWLQSDYKKIETDRPTFD